MTAIIIRIPTYKEVILLIPCLLKYYQIQIYYQIQEKLDNLYKSLITPIPRYSYNFH